MKLINARNGIEFSPNAKVATSFHDKLFGLLAPENPRSLVFFTRFGIHTYFMRHDIDVIILDRDNEVRVIKEGLKPFNFFFYPLSYIKVIELPSGSVSVGDIIIGDKILFA